VIVGLENDNHKQEIWTTLKLYGATCNPWDAWLTHNGMKTLELRMKAHSSNSSKLASYLTTNKKVGKINHLSLTSHTFHDIAKRQMDDWGGMISFEVGTNLSDALKFANSLNFCTQAPTLGDVDTLILHPASSSHLNVDRKLREQNGITDNLIRVSVGIENIDDIIQDIDQALKAL
jgi:methionine-gamma-lyase